MSGEAGALLEGEYYSIFVGSGINISIDIGPGGDDSQVGDYFREANAPFEEWLSRVRPKLDALFAASTLPLGPLSERFEQVDGAIIDKPDGSAEHFRHYAKRRPLRLFLDGGRRLDDFRSLRVIVQVKERVPRKATDQLLDAVAALLKANP